MEINNDISSEEEIFFGSSEEEEFNKWMDELQLNGVNEYHWKYLLWLDIL